MTIHEGESLRKWLKLNYKGTLQSLADGIGVSRQKLYILFKEYELPSDEKDAIINFFEGKDTSGIFSRRTITQNNEQGNNYQGSTHNEGINNELIELRIENKYLKDKIKTLEEMINILKDKNQ